MIPHPDIQATTLAWSPDGNGAVLGYNIKDADLPNPTDISLFWSNRNTVAQPQPGDFFSRATAVDLNTEVTEGPHEVPIPASFFAPPPAGTQYLIARLNKTGAVVESDGDGGAAQDTNFGNDLAYTRLVVNQPAVTISVKPAPPLQSGAPVRKNLPYTATFSVTNKGPVPLNFSLAWDQLFGTPVDLTGTGPGQPIRAAQGNLLGLGQGVNIDSAGFLQLRPDQGMPIGIVGYQQTKDYTPGTFVSGWHWIDPKNPVNPDSFIEELKSDIFKATLQGGLAGVVFDHLTGDTLLDKINQYLKPIRQGQLTFKVDVQDATGQASNVQSQDVTLLVPQYLRDHFLNFTESYTLAKSYMSAAIAGALAGQPEATAAFAALSILKFETARREYDEAVDPLDPNYTQLVTPTPLSLPAVESLPDGPYKRLAQTGRDLQADKAAEGVSLDRAAAAAQAGDFSWQSQQLGAAATFAAQASALEDQLAAEFAPVKRSVAANFATYLDQIVGYLQTNGLPQAVSDVLSQAGWSAGDIAGFQRTLIQTGGPGYADADFLALAVPASSLLDNTTAGDELQRQVDVQVGILGQAVRELDPSARQALDAERADIMARLASNVPSDALRTGIESFLADTLRLVQQTNNPRAMQGDFQFGYDALDSLLQLYVTGTVPAAQTIAFGSLGQQQYGVAPATVTATATSGLPVSFTVDSGPAVISGNTLTITGAGTVVVRASQAGDDNYNPAPDVSQSFDVSPAPLTVTADSKSMVYGSTLPALTATFTGLVNGDTPSTIQGLTLATVSAGSAVGSYPITPANATDSNYTISYSPGSLTVTKATPTVSVSDAGGVYNGMPSAVTGTTVTGVNGASLARLGDSGLSYAYYAGATATGTGSATAPKNAGTYTVVGHWTSNDANYTSADSGAVTFVIAARNLAVTATGVDKVYDGTVTDAVTLSDNRVAGDALAVSYTSAAFGDMNVGAAKTVNVNGITVAGTDAGNYTLAASTASTTASITPRALTLTATTLTKVYGTADPIVVYQITSGSLVVGDAISGALSRQPGEGVGTFAIQLGSLTAGANYAITYIGANLTITPATLTATGVAVAATAGAPFSGVVARFTNADPFGGTVSYQAAITWGDGYTSAGTITDIGSGTFAVTGNHTYADPGTATVQVQIRHILGYTTTATTSNTATAANLKRSIQEHQVQDVEFWRDDEGQALINKFNGGSSSTALATWLATNFTNLYGSGAGDHDLTGKTNAHVANFFQSLVSQKSRKLDAEVLATALNVYATTLSLGGTAGAAYGFKVDAYGLGADSFNIDHDGEGNDKLFDGLNSRTMNVFQILRSVDKKAVGGVLYNGDKKMRNLAEKLFDDLNGQNDD